LGADESAHVVRLDEGGEVRNGSHSFRLPARRVRSSEPSELTVPSEPSAPPKQA
jgi:hypothetical protein